MHMLMILAGILLFAAPAFGASLSTQYTGGADYSAFGLSGSIDLNEDETWTGWGSYTHAKIAQGTDSNSHQVSLGVDRDLCDTDRLGGGLTFWTDTINKIRYIGPSADYDHTFVDGEGSEILTGSLSSDLFFYGAEVPTDSSGRVRRRGLVGRSSQRETTVTQFRLTAGAEKPFFDRLFTPFASFGHYFYSRKPSDIESDLDRRSLQLNPSVVAGTGSLAGGFLSNQWDAGVRVRFPSQTTLRLEYGRAQSAIDSSWVPTYAVNVSQVIAERYRARLGWSRTGQSGVSSDYFSGGVGYDF